MEISNDAYSSAWAGDHSKAPSLDAVYDRLQQIANASGFPQIGTYQPISSTLVNLNNILLDPAQYLKLQDTVIVSGTFTTRVTTLDTPSNFSVTMPFASNFSVSSQAAGVGSFGFVGSQWYITALSTTKLIRLSSRPSAANANNTACSYIYGYKIIP